MSKIITSIFNRIEPLLKQIEMTKMVDTRGIKKEVNTIVDVLDAFEEMDKEEVLNLIREENLKSISKPITINDMGILYRKLYFVYKLINVLKKEKSLLQVFMVNLLTDDYKKNIMVLYTKRKDLIIKTPTLDQYEENIISTNSDERIEVLLDDITNMIQRQNAMKLDTNKKVGDFYRYRYQPTQFLKSFLQKMEELYYYIMASNKEKIQDYVNEMLGVVLNSYFKRQTDYMLYWEKIYDNKNQTNPSFKPSPYFGKVMEVSEVEGEVMIEKGRKELYEDDIRDFLFSLSNYIHIVKEIDVRKWILTHLFMSLEKSVISPLNEFKTSIFNIPNLEINMNEETVVSKPKFLIDKENPVIRSNPNVYKITKIDEKEVGDCRNLVGHSFVVYVYKNELVVDNRDLEYIVDVIARAKSISRLKINSDFISTVEKRLLQKLPGISIDREIVKENVGEQFKQEKKETNKEDEKVDEDVVKFGDGSFLSPHYMIPIIIREKEWPSVEHYYQASRFDDKEYTELIRKASTVKKAISLGEMRKTSVTQRVGKTKKSPLVNEAIEMAQKRGVKQKKDWEIPKNRLKTMIYANKIKFQNEELMKMLVETGDKKLAYISNDKFWGEKGQNKLGTVLEKIRQS